MKNSPKVKIIVSEDIETQKIQDNSTRTILINPVQIMRSQYIPTNLSVALTIVVSKVDWNQDHEVKIILKNPRTERILTELIPPVIKSGSISPHIDNFSFTLDLKNVDIQDEGSYEVEFIFDGHPTIEEFEVLQVGV